MKLIVTILLVFLTGIISAQDYTTGICGFDTKASMDAYTPNIVQGECRYAQVADSIMYAWSAVSNSWVRQLHLGDSLILSENLGNTNLIQTAEARTYDANGQQLIFSNSSLFRAQRAGGGTLEASGLGASIYSPDFNNYVNANDVGVILSINDASDEIGIVDPDVVDNYLLYLDVFSAGQANVKYIDPATVGTDAQSISLATNTLSISGNASTVDLSSYLDNTNLATDNLTQDAEARTYDGNANSLAFSNSSVFSATSSTGSNSLNVNSSAAQLVTGGTNYVQSDASGVTIQATGTNSLKLNGTATGKTAIQFEELSGNGSNYVGFIAADNIPANVTWELPSTDGTNGQVLQTDGAGVLSWASGATGDNIYTADGTIGSGRTVGVTDNVNFDANTFVINGTDNQVLIGTATPVAGKALVVEGDMDVTGVIDPTKILFGLGSTNSFNPSTEGEFQIEWADNLDLNFKSNTTDNILHLTNAGLVGVGTNSGAAKLTVQNSGTEDILNLSDSGAEVFTVIDGGNVGINETSPQHELHINGALGKTNIRVDDSRQNININSNSVTYTANSTENIVIGHNTLQGGVVMTSNTFIGTNVAATPTAAIGSNNTGIGAYTFQGSTFGNNNTGFGLNTARVATIGSNNSFFGQQAGYGVTGGTDFHLILGGAAGINSTLNGNNNTIIGASAANLSTLGAENLFMIGASGITADSNNIVIGVGAGNANTLDDGNIIMGRFAGDDRSSTTWGSENVAIGEFAASNLTLSNGNTFLGGWTTSGVSNIQFSTALGYAASVEKSNQIVIGTTGGGNLSATETEETKFYGALNFGSSKTNATVIDRSMYSDSNGLPYYRYSGSSYPVIDTSGIIDTVYNYNKEIQILLGSDPIKIWRGLPEQDHSLAIGGTGNLSKVVVSGASGTYNTAIGQNVLVELVNGSDNTFSGANAGNNLVTSWWNTVSGHSAMQAAVDAQKSVVMGTFAARTGNKIDRSVFIGMENGEEADSVDYTVSIGYQSGRRLNGSSFNTFVGTNNGPFVTSGENNSFFGRSVGGTVTTGSRNTIAGWSSGDGITTGNANTIIGGNVTGLGNPSNNIIIADGDGNIAIRDDGTTLSLSDQIQFANYTGTTFDGTPTSFLGVDATGNVIKNTLSGYTVPDAGAGNKSFTVLGDLDVTGVIDPTKILFGLGSTNSFDPSANGEFQIEWADNLDLNFKSNTIDNILHLENGGNVGIGTSAPAVQLQIGDGTDALEQIYINSTSGLAIGTSGGSAFGYTSGNLVGSFALNSPLGFWTQTAQPLLFGSNGPGEADMAIDAEGDVGIGVVTSDARLTINNGSQSQDILNLLDNGTEVLTVVDGGNVGIGTSAPTAKLHVSGVSNRTGVYVSDVNTSLDVAYNATGIVSGTIWVFSSTVNATDDVRHQLRNTNSTSSTANAFSLIQVEGANAGNPYQEFNVNGESAWGVGVDNDDSDKFKIIPGSFYSTNRGLTMDYSGNTGIGTHFPSTKLHVSGGQVRFDNYTGTNYDNASPSYTLTVDGSGNVTKSESHIPTLATSNAIVVGTTASHVTITAAATITGTPTSGVTYWVRNKSTGNVVLTTANGVFDDDGTNTDVTTITIADGQSIKLVGDGTNWTVWK